MGIDADFEYKIGMVFMLKEYMNVGVSNSSDNTVPYFTLIHRGLYVSSSARGFHL